MQLPEESQSRVDYEGSSASLPHNDRAPALTPAGAIAEQSRATENLNEIVRDGGEHVVTDDLDALLAALPAPIVEPLKRLNNRVNLLEVVMDLGRKPEARYRGSEATLTENEITRAELDYVISHIGEFGG